MQLLLLCALLLGSGLGEEAEPQNVCRLVSGKVGLHVPLMQCRPLIELIGNLQKPLPKGKYEESTL